MNCLLLLIILFCCNGNGGCNLGCSNTGNCNLAGCNTGRGNGRGCNTVRNNERGCNAERERGGECSINRRECECDSAPCMQPHTPPPMPRTQFPYLDMEPRTCGCEEKSDN